MSINTILLVLAAILPALLLCNYVYKKDSTDKEPKGLLIKLFFAGVISCFPAAEAEMMLEAVIDGVFSGLSNIGLPSSFLYSLYNIVFYFIGVALVEEGVKWFCLVRLTRNDKNFDCMFDGLIYAVFVSLGFAAFENILYVVEFGWFNAFVRAVLSVPGHMFFGVMMGYYYSRWNLLKSAAEAEEELVRSGTVIKRNEPEFDYRTERTRSILIPVLFHGIYDFCCSADSLLLTVMFYGFVIFMYIHCFGKIKEMSREDTPTGKKMLKLLTDKYPEIYEEVENG